MIGEVGDGWLLGVSRSNALPRFLLKRGASYSDLHVQGGLRGTELPWSQNASRVTEITCVCLMCSFRSNELKGAVPPCALLTDERDCDMARPAQGYCSTHRSYVTYELSFVSQDCVQDYCPCVCAHGM